LSVAEIKNVPAKFVPAGGVRVSVIEAEFEAESVPGVGEIVAQEGKVFDEKTSFCPASASVTLYVIVVVTPALIVKGLVFGVLDIIGALFVVFENARRTSRVVNWPIASFAVVFKT
jgi:hypothetical protein